MAEEGDKVIDPDILGIILELPRMAAGSSMALSGILKGRRMENFYKKLMGSRMLSDLNIPIVIPSVDILSGKTIAFTNYINNKPVVENVLWYSNAYLYEVVRASCSIPGIFAPKNINGMALVDGGLTNNLPVDLLISSGVKKVIGVDITSKYSPPSKVNITETIASSFRIMSITLRDCTSRNEILMLTPPLPDSASLFCFRCMNESMEIGYDYTIKNLSKIRSVLET